MYINLIKKRKIIMSITLISVHKKKKKNSRYGKELIII